MTTVRTSVDGQGATRAPERTTEFTGHLREAPGQPVGGFERTAGEQKVPELIMQATSQLSDLIRAELRLAVAEIKSKGRHAGGGVGLFGGAGLVALYAVGALVAGAIAALALVLPLWASGLVIGGGLLLVAAVLGLVGRRQISHAIPPMPEQAMGGARQDLTEIKERAHR